MPSIGAIENMAFFFFFFKTVQRREITSNKGMNKKTYEHGRNDKNFLLNMCSEKKKK